MVSDFSGKHSGLIRKENDLNPFLSIRFQRKTEALSPQPTNGWPTFFLYMNEQFNTYNHETN
jgi:hypothetical protein